MRRILGLLFPVLAVGIGRLPGRSPGVLPAYRAEGRQFGEIRTWGNEAMANVLRLWEVSIFEGSYQRGLRFVDTLPSGACAIGALYTGMADLGAMGHHCWPIELEGFRQVFGYDPLEITVATGAYDVPGKMPPNVIFVNQDNPLSRLTLPQLDGIFGEQRTGGWQGREWSTASARGAKENLRTWGQLGLTGDWADKPIHVLGFDLTGSSFPFSMQRMAMGGGGKWNPELREFVLNEIGLIYGSGPRPRQGTEILTDAVADDPYAISYASIQYIRDNPRLKPLALAKTAAGPYVAPSKANMLNRSYPLVESIYVYINRRPGQPVEPKLREFLRYILSREGQRAVAEDGGYLPLPAEVVREELRKLDDGCAREPPEAATALWENSLGMKFAPVAGTTVSFSIWPTRVRDFAAFARATGYDATRGVYSLAGKGWVHAGDSWQHPGFAQGDTHPVCAVSWRDAKAFCRWLTRQEAATGLIHPGFVYRLPTDSEWMVAVGMREAVAGPPRKNTGVFPWGNAWPPPSGAGNYAGEEAKDETWPVEWPPIAGYNDGYPRTSPVGAFHPNRFGLYDMSGNVWEWCEDLYDAKGTTRVVRGASYRVYLPDLIKLTRRGDGDPASRYVHRGFRCVLAPETTTDAGGSPDGR